MPFSTLAGERFITHNLIVGAGTFSAGLLGVVFQVLVSHRLRPAEYGGVFAVLTLLNLIWLPAGGLTLLMARQTGRDRAAGNDNPSVALLGNGNRTLILFGAGIAAVVGLTSPFLAPLLQVPLGLLLAAAVGIPFGLALPLLLGVFQGSERFVAFAAFAGGQAAAKIVAALAIGALLGPLGVILGISIGTAVIYLAAFTSLRHKFDRKEKGPWLRPAISYLAIILPSTLAVAALLSVDVLMAKHYFGARLAGEYAAVAAIGRAIFWGAAAVVAVLFPKMVFRESGGKRGSNLVFWSLFAVAICGVLGIAVLWRWSHFIITTFAGAAYAAGAAYLWWYGLGMALIGAASVLIATNQSRAKAAFLWVLLSVAIAEPALIVWFHRDPMQVVLVLDACMVSLVAGLVAVYLWSERPIPRHATFRNLLGQVHIEHAELLAEAPAFNGGAPD